MSSTHLKLLLRLVLLFVFIEKVIGQTNPTPQNLPYIQDFGTSDFSSPKVGMASWTGDGSRPYTTQAAAESSSGGADATISNSTPTSSGTGGQYGHAPSSNGRLTILQSGNLTNGTTMVVLAINTVGYSAVSINYDLILTIANARSVSISLQYRIGTTGAFTGISGSAVTYNSSTSNGEDSDGPSDFDSYSFTLPNEALNQSEVQLRWVTWRGTESGFSSGIGIDNINVFGCNTYTNFYSKPVGNLNSTATWGLNTDGSGTAPANFTNSCQVFNIRNGNPATLTAPWAVSGVGSKIVVEQTDFTIPNTHVVTGTIDVNANRTLTLQNATLPTLSTLSPSSTVVYAQGGSITPISRNYGTVVLDNTSVSNPASPVDWELYGSLMLQNGGACNAPNLGINTAGTLNQSLLGGNFTIRSFDNTLKTNGDLILGNNIQVTIGTPGSGALRGTFTGVGNQFIDNGSTITIGNNLRLGGNKNGYLLTGTIILVNNSGNTNITGSEDNSNAIAAELNNLVSNVSGTATTSFRPNTGKNDIVIKGNLSITGAGTGTVFFNENNLSIGGSFFYDRTTDYINEGTSNVIFYGVGVHTITSNVSAGLTFYMLGLQKSGTIIQNTNLSVSNKLTINSGVWDAKTFTLGSSTSLLSITGGNLRLAKTGVTLPEFSKTGSDAYQITGGAIELYGSGLQTLRGGRDYATLLFTGSTQVSLTSSPNSVLGVGVYDNAVLDVGNNSSFGDQNGATLTMTGNALYRTSGGGTQPSFRDLYTLSPNTTFEFYGSGASTAIRQGPTTGGSQPHRYQNILMTGNVTVTAPANVLRIEGNFINSLTGGLFVHNGGTVSLTGLNQTLTGIGSTAFHNLHWANSGTKTVQSPISVANVLSLCGTANGHVESGGQLTLLSTPTQTARIGIVPNGSTITGMVTQQRYMPGRSTGNISYQIGMPLNDVSVQEIQGNSTNTGIYVTGNFTNKSIPSTVTGISALAGPNLFYFDPINQVMKPFPSVGGSNLNVFTLGVGYRILDRDMASSMSPTQVIAKNLQYNGFVHCGDFDYTLSYPGSGTLLGWNFIANPYASAIIGDLLNTMAWPVRTDVNAAVYVWDAVNARFQSYVNGVGTYGWNGIIPSMQGFWVRTNGTSTQLRIAEQAKNTNESNTIYRQHIKNQCILSMMEVHDSIPLDQSIAYLAEAGVNIDANSALRITTESQPLQVSLMHDNKAYSILALQADSAYIPIALRLPARTTRFLISVDTMLSAHHWFLNDQALDTTYSIRPKISLEIPSTISGYTLQDRFILQFIKSKQPSTGDDTLKVNQLKPIDAPTYQVVQDSAATGTESFEETNMQVYPNPVKRNQKLKVEFSQVKSALQLQWISTEGKIIETKRFDAPVSYIQLKAPQKIGNYVLRIIENSQVIYTKPHLVID